MCLKKLTKWGNKKMKKFDIWDIALIKWSTLFATLFLVTVWDALAKALLSVDWYWYLIAMVILMWRPMKKMFS
ncbi:hypothetical protein GOV10_01910 [Candidatus Woesearchaeota archaeon]|nr:hypothetical protein [Candidatus Woesearchaeota archaeon]